MPKTNKIPDIGITVAEAMKAELLTARMEYQQEIRERAYEIFCNRDSSSATALDDWLKAEQKIAARKICLKRLLLSRNSKPSTI